jgi:signal transduction histidine kinase
LRDITERRRRLTEQSRARRLASMATLTSGIAHEIKNPLNALKIHAQLLQGELDKASASGKSVSPERVRRVAEVVEEETERLSRTVEEFLQAARPHSPHLQEHPIGDLIGLLEQIFAAECEKHGIHLETSVDPELPPVMLDEHQMLQALRNLIRNAIEALVEKIKEESDEFLPRLGLSATLDDDAVRLVVADNGPGIPPDTIEHVMEAYFTTKFGGTGLGLMVVDRIVTEHHGSLHVHTEPGQGTEFIILLPLHQKPLRFLDAAAEEDGDEADEAEGARESGEAAEGTGDEAETDAKS